VSAARAHVKPRIRFSLARNGACQWSSDPAPAIAAELARDRGDSPPFPRPATREPVRSPPPPQERERPSRRGAANREVRDCSIWASARGGTLGVVWIIAAAGSRTREPGLSAPQWVCAMSTGAAVPGRPYPEGSPPARLIGAGQRLPESVAGADHACRGQSAPGSRGAGSWRGRFCGGRDGRATRSAPT